jgi:hypothetical protein
MSISVRDSKKSKEQEEDREEDHEEEQDDDGEDDGEDDGDDEDDDEDDDRVPIDLSTNEVYRGVCTLFEDEEGNNILEYISLLHTELIGINKSMENLRTIRKDIGRLADIAELYVKASMNSSSSSSSEHKKDKVRKDKL